MDSDLEALVRSLIRSKVNEPHGVGALLSKYSVTIHSLCVQYLVFSQQSSDGVLVCEVTAQKAEPGSPVSRPSDGPSGAVKLSAHRSPQEACRPGNQDTWRPHQQLLLST